jgi:hypothetical protein
MASIPIEGYGTLGDTYAVTLYIGRTAGITYGEWKEGETISGAEAVAAVMRRRAQQVGDRVSATVIDARGYYKKGTHEDAIQVRVIFVRSDRERSAAAFTRNIRQLAQAVAGDLAQREVYVDWQIPGRAVRTVSASPKPAPAPTNEKAFCAWVRKHSDSARTDPDDACYAPPRKRK